MAFGPIIDVPLMSGIFAATVRYRTQFADAFYKLRLPAWILYLLSATMLLIIEEHINCMPEWCLHVIIPPTIPFLVGVVFVFLLIIKLLRIRRLWIQTLMFSALGIFIELGGGPISAFVRTLLATRPVFLCLMTIWIGISYAFVIVVPLTVLNRKTAAASEAKSATDFPAPPTPAEPLKERW